MKAEFSVSFEGDHIKASSVGDKTVEFAERVWSEIAATCDRHSCYRVLGVAESTTPMTPFEGYDHAKLFRNVGISDTHRIAWVELNPDALDTIRFIETVLTNRGFRVRAFSDVDEARAWLFDG